MASKDGDTLAEAVMDVLRAHFDVPKRATAVREASVPGLEGSLRPDLVVRSKGSLYLVSVRHRPSVQDVAMALLAREALAGGGREGPSRVEVVVLGKVIPDDVRTLAESVGVHAFQLDWRVGIAGGGRPPTGLRARKVTSEKAWRVTFALLGTGPTSIKALARATGLSYGWAHATVSKLMDMGVASRTAEGVSVVDVGRLLNGVAWERPLEELRRRTLRVEGKDAARAARTVQSALDGWGVTHAFTAWTAGALYSGYVERSDSVHVYLPGRDWGFLRELEAERGGVTLVVYAPDRDVFSAVERVRGLDLVSPAQALLDLAGLGHAAHDLAMEMAMRHAGRAR